MSFVKVLVSVPDSASTMKSILNINVPGNQFSGQYLEKFIVDLITGAQLGYLKLSTGAVQATGTVTFASIADGDTITINGVVLTAKTSPSGASQFAIGASDTAAATNFAAKINASALAGLVAVVSATAVGPVTTVTAVQPGLAANAVTLAISAHGSVSGARMTGGSDGSQVTANFGRPS